MLIVGTIGVGKSTVAVEAGTILERQGTPHAVVDLDWLAWMYPPPPGGFADLIRANLALIVHNLRAAGARHLILSRSVQHDAEIDQISSAISPTVLKVVLLTASRAETSARLRRRDHGRTLAEHLAQSEAMESSVRALTRVDARIPAHGEPQAIAMQVLHQVGLT